MQCGKLKIFFGYSAGVGKTYSMLAAARELAAEGLDVVIGYLEPHDRPDTLNMAQGLETLPLKEFPYKNVVLKDFDVDAALARRPQLILVDELAHTNAVGSKNRKRYLDVEELLHNGIDVYTTVNVQHIESLHDTVSSATSVDVNERIPDEIFDYADEVELIDIEPSDLIDRMREGKIYKRTRDAALENFFRSDNLSALRELSMRRSADRIEKQTHCGELKTKILVLISPSPSSQKNIRIAARMAEAYHCRYSAMYVETSGDLSDEAAANLKKHMNLVRDTGGGMIVKYADSVVETVSDYVRLAGVTNLIIGKTWRSVGKKVGLEDRFIAELPNIELLIVPDSEHFPAHVKSLMEIWKSLFRGTKLMQKFKTANRILNISDLIAQATLESDAGGSRNQRVAEVLARAFSRSCVIADGQRACASWNGEKTEYFDAANERAVAEWCRKNGRAAGRGTDTLRGASATYFPLKTARETVVVGFGCEQSKMSLTDRLIFRQLENFLRAVL